MERDRILQMKERKGQEKEKKTTVKLMNLTKFYNAISTDLDLLNNFNYEIVKKKLKKNHSKDYSPFFYVSNRYNE